MKKEMIADNYLLRVPVRPAHMEWFADEEGLVTLDIENKGLVNRMLQKMLQKPKVSHIHLDEMGSFIWPLIDGEKNIIELGKLVEDEFGGKADPLYERLAKYFQILESYCFIEWK